MRASTKRRGSSLLRTVVAGLLVVAGPVLLAGPAGAAKTVGACVAEIVEEELDARGVAPGTPEARAVLEEIQDDAYERCLDAPNPLFPSINEVIWGAVGFFAVYFFIWRFGFPAIKSAMTARAERIESDLEAAAAQRSEADQILADYRAQLADARNESARIIEEARQSADALRREQEARLQSELAEMRQRANADIEAAKANAIADLRNEVAALAVGAAEVIIQRNLDQAAQAELVDSYIRSVARGRT
jgi:F-type H+-transporting ATPase subunit b